MPEKQRKYQTSDRGRIKQHEARQRYAAFKLLSEFMGDDLTEWVESQVLPKEKKFEAVARLLKQLKESGK